jgi:hypothetical protein
VNAKEKAAFHVAVVDALLSLGSPVDDKDTTWGWIASDYAELGIHMAHCRPVYEACAWDDSEWSEFIGTFDPPRDKQGIDLKLACACGLLTGRTWRYAGGYAELIRAITGG